MPKTKIFDTVDPDYLDKMKEVYFTNPTQEELDQIDSEKFGSEGIDIVMQEPYVKIKIKNLFNFKIEPLEIYDIERLKE